VATRASDVRRYQELISVVERSTPLAGMELPRPRLYGLPTEFSPEPVRNHTVINFDLEIGVPVRYPFQTA